MEYFAFLLVDGTLIDREERYQKQSYRNRAVIMNGNGVLNLIIPTIHDNRMGVVKEVRNTQLTLTLLKILQTGTNVGFTETFTPYGDDDLRLEIHPKKARKPDYRYRLTTPYYQVFEDKFGFQPNLSIIDLLFNEGPQAASYLHRLANTFETR